MEIFLDSADVFQIEMMMKRLNITGITTNPKLSNIKSALEVAKKFKLPTSIQIEYSSPFDVVEKAKSVNTPWSVIKLPVSELEAGKMLIKMGFKVNFTLCFSLYQIICAANLGADYVSIFVGRLMDQGGDPEGLIRKAAEYILKSNVKTKIIAASIRNIEQLEMAADAGADIVTVAPNILLDYRNTSTEAGIMDFFENKLAG